MLGDLARGESLFSPELANKILKAFTPHQAESAPVAVGTMYNPDTSTELTGRQTDILRLVSQGLPYKEIGARLYLTERTVKYHMGEILARLHLKGRRAAMDYARRKGLT
jgi:DNA-binding NarL/FixJ family response regulator